jgi:sulfite oxidase
MSAVKDAEPEGLKWGEGTICNVRWGGIFLRDLLLKLWPHTNDSTLSSKTNEYHVAFGLHAVGCEQDDHFESSVPLSKVLDEDGDVLLAFEANCFCVMIRA